MRGARHQLEHTLNQQCCAQYFGCNVGDAINQVIEKNDAAYRRQHTQKHKKSPALDEQIAAEKK